MTELFMLFNAVIIFIYILIDHKSAASLPHEHCEIVTPPDMVL